MKYLEEANSETESGMVVARGWGRVIGSQCLMDTEFQLGEMKKLWKWMAVMVPQQCDTP